jgi:hypothetical protein
MKTIDYIFLVLVSIHGLIHLLGYSRAFHLGLDKPGMTPISKVNGVFWFMATVLFIVTSLTIYFTLYWWWIIALVAVFLSQYLIFTSWAEAKYGTIINFIVLLAISAESYAKLLFQDAANNVFSF